MRIALTDIEQLTGAYGFIRGIFEQLAASISVAWDAQHANDGSHGDITATRLTFKETGAIAVDTDQDADTAAVFVTGAGAVDMNRAAYAATYGNQHVSFPGYVYAQIGNVTGSKLRIARGDGTEAAAIDGATGGMTLGNATGGENGLGTLNCAGDIYKNNSAYNNPAYVIEHWKDGRVQRFIEREGAAEYPGLMPLRDVEAFIRENYHLPRVPEHEPAGMFKRSDVVLEKLEEIFIHLIGMEKRLGALEASAHDE